MVEVSTGDIFVCFKVSTGDIFVCVGYLLVIYLCVGGIYW